MRSRKVEIISKELVNPTSPTPDHLRCLNLSILDQRSPLMTVPFILYYPHPQQQVCPDQQSRLLLLKESLSQVLARFYPFAGRINSLYTSIICNDYGVPFSHAFAHNYNLDDIIAEPSSNVSLLKHFLPYEESKLSTNIPLLVQVTFFECGGITIGLCASHKFTDAPTLNTLITDWAVAARCDPRAAIHEFISAAKFLPPVTVTSDHQPELSYLLPDKVSAANHVTKIFYFDSSSIKALKAKAVSDSVPMPTRVEALSALIWKCAMSATTSEKTQLLIHTVNLRKRMVLALPDDCIGNAIALYKAICKDKKDMDLPGLVILLRRGLLEFRDEYEIKHRE